MRLLFRSLSALAVVLTLGLPAARAQEPEVTPTPTATPSPEVTAPAEEPAPAAPTPLAQQAAPPPPSAPVAPTVATPAAPIPTPVPAPVATPTPLPPARVSDPPVVAILKAPAENPFGLSAELPAALPPKLTFADAVLNAAQFVSARVDANGKSMGVKQERDPIPSLSGEAQRSLARWVFDPARRGAEAVETWAALRLDLEVEIGAPRSVQGNLTPVTPATPIVKPLAWPSDQVWLETRKAPPPTDGVVPIETVDTPPMPRKTPWTAESYRGPFLAKFWVKVTPAGTVEKAIPIEASEPILLVYLRRAISTWAFRPAQAHGAPAASWNELALSGQIAYKVELKQIASLRRSLSGS